MKAVGLLTIGLAAWSTLFARSAGAVAQAVVTEKDMSEANDPLADLNVITFQDYYAPSLDGVPNQTANVMNLKGIKISGRQLIRLTVPLVTAPDASGRSRSGLGDCNIFDAIKFSPEDSELKFAAGPLLVAPTASPEALGQGKWQAGLAAIVIRQLEGGSLLGMLATWQQSFAGDSTRPAATVVTSRFYATATLSGGWYFRSSPLLIFDIGNGR
jgi:hypothetical protein